EPRMFLVALIVVVIILSSNGYGPFQIAAEIAGSYVRWTISILM
ncbi:MAG: hypothetical protein ACI9S9_004639, partial [Planctomycetota bacterium]